MESSSRLQSPVWLTITSSNAYWLAFYPPHRQSLVDNPCTPSLRGIHAYYRATECRQDLKSCAERVSGKYHREPSVHDSVHLTQVEFLHQVLS